jgi:hypothetical protein
MADAPENTKIDYTKAAVDARQLLRGFRAFDELARAFESVSAALASQAEAELVLSRLLVEIGEARDTLAKTKADAEAMLVAARAEASVLVANGNEIKTRVIAEADEHAAAVKANADAAVADARRRVEAANKLQEQAEAATTKARSELAVLEGKIADTKAQIQKLLG